MSHGIREERRGDGRGAKRNHEYPCQLLPVESSQCLIVRVECQVEASWPNGFAVGFQPTRASAIGWKSLQQPVFNHESRRAGIRGSQHRGHLHG